MSQEINSPQVIAIFAAVVVGAILLIFITIAVLQAVDHIHRHRQDTRILKAAEEARRDFR